MPFRFVEHLTQADVAFKARGRTLPEMFAAAGRAVTRTMVTDLRSVRAKETRSFTLTAEQVDLLLFNFLQEMIYLKDVDLLLFSRFKVAIRHPRRGPWTLAAVLKGERIDPQRHELLVDVKAVTMHRFEVARDRSGWKATVVLDI